jgi:hypothetical protein
MNRIKQQHFLNREKLASNEIDFFFEVLLKRLGQELERMRKTIFNYKVESGKERKPTVYEDIFGLNEQAWVGVLNNAIIRAFPKADTLQEFTVYNDSDDGVKRNFHGRADFLVHWKNFKGEKINLLFEAKQYKEIDATKMKEDSTVYITEIINQAKSYIDADKEYFKKRENLYIIPIVFAWIPTDELLIIAKDYMNSEEEKAEHFCSLFFENESGAWVYGSVEYQEN